ncbi:Casein kinase II regulatory subunit family protein [Trichomonas vaginalis G3]|uniref:Casein kinase II subunit beta n=1 Tax=Trichomonas vaginalis (strain ATCC PRA-98 / G3) TaxID=412133 RepID=A2ETT1_TRIV3|nr:Casein kinase II regulatory subunit family protein [Trichomonas vaginalis G3]|eukprot:XP_001316185.1 Casein kinase II regulatory subunit family protein [Trichomonas vaginalis G3]
MKGWIDNILARNPYKILVRVPDEFIKEQAQDKEIQALSKHPQTALKLILQKTNSTESTSVEEDTMALYGGIHARYIETDEGMAALLEKYKEQIFHRCPRVLCRCCLCLPYGVSTTPSEVHVQWYCPNCSDVYALDSDDTKKIDGSWFGPNYIRSFLNKYPGVIPTEPALAYEPRIFGFRLYASDKPKE